MASRLRNTLAALRIEANVLQDLVGAARRHSTAAIEEFQNIVQRSAALIPTLGEPLVALDFREHRWVGGQREEAYSDWLQWICANAEPIEVLQIFRVDSPDMVLACTGSSRTITRERRVPYGHEGAGGRLDLEIQLGDAALIVVEVKLSEAESADNEKNLGYFLSVETKHPELLKAYVILVIDAEKDDYHGFRPCRWAATCIRLRLIAARLCLRGEHLRAAMILGFVAAVEQNVLKLQSAIPGTGDPVAAVLTLPRITDHLNQFVEAAVHDKAEGN
jgi:hypothetical protein